MYKVRFHFTKRLKANMTIDIDKTQAKILLMLIDGKPINNQEKRELFSLGDQLNKKR